MSNIYGILNMGSRAFLTQQLAIEVTGNNIANVNTPGYSRQRVNMETSKPVTSQAGQMGTGVNASDIQRVYDRFISGQINTENQNLGRWEAEKGALERVEMIFDESSGYGLNQQMGEFWNAWQDLANNPSGQAERSALLAKSQTMANTFNKTYSDLIQIQNDIDSGIKGTVGEINLIAEQIADLNQQISQVEVRGETANDYRDKRDLLLKELSSMIDINSFEDNDGKVTVLVGKGKPLVENVSSWILSTETNDSDSQKIVWNDGNGNSVNITDNISGGKLKGWLEVRDVTIPDYLNRLDTLAGSIISEVNALHKPEGDLQNVVFFEGDFASDIVVNQAIIADINKISAGSADGAPRDNSKAIAIANLQNGIEHGDIVIDGATFDDYYNSLVSDVGSRVQKATINFDHQSEIVDQLDNYRESVSGVSLDEEMVNLLKFQNAYEAAAKLITTVDEMLDTVIGMV